MSLGQIRFVTYIKRLESMYLQGFVIAVTDLTGP